MKYARYVLQALHQVRSGHAPEQHDGDELHPLRLIEVSEARFASLVSSAPRALTLEHMMYTATADFKIRKMDGVEYLVPIGGKWSESADLMELNPVSAVIWRSLPGDLSGVTKAVVAAFEVDEETARQDVEEFLQELVELGLVVDE
ncbi:PqqD family protein [Actinoplanes sp. NPDC026619]|uniref:PqqD family protein n=1 Tax=Actinoplanes sp. NPDC026619 TaxID=3155798 RepID=UPI0033BFFC84